MIFRRNSGDSALLEESIPPETQALTLGISSQHREPAPELRRRPTEMPHGEEKISLFWRVFGGTILSIVALALLTVYNNLNSTINELRNEVSRANEARAELVKKEEFNTRSQSVWNKLQELQELRGTITVMRDQMTSRDSHGKSQEEDRRELTRQLQELRERVARVETLRDHVALPKIPAGKN